MAIDSKYGHVTLEHGTIGDDEPVVVFRAQDRTLLRLLDLYRDLCVAEGSPDRHMDGIVRAAERVRVWQELHFTQVPQSEVHDGE